jgi:hypothetical protein
MVGGMLFRIARHVIDRHRTAVVLLLLRPLLEIKMVAIVVDVKVRKSHRPVVIDPFVEVGLLVFNNDAPAFQVRKSNDGERETRMEGIMGLFVCHGLTWPYGLGLLPRREV